MPHKAKFMYVGSSGGHLLELLKIHKIFRDFESSTKWVTFRKPDAEYRLAGETVHWCHFPTTRNLKNFILNSVQAFRVIASEKPDVIVSTGAAIAVSYAWIGRLFGVKIIFIEATNRVRQPSLTGRLVYPVSHLFCVQWPKLLRSYPRAEHIGPIV